MMALPDKNLFGFHFEVANFREPTTTEAEYLVDHRKPKFHF